MASKKHITLRPKAEGYPERDFDDSTFLHHNRKTPVLSRSSRVSVLYDRVDAAATYGTRIPSFPASPHRRWSLHAVTGCRDHHTGDARRHWRIYAQKYLLKPSFGGDPRTSGYFTVRFWSF